jgi:hypothetical protein
LSRISFFPSHYVNPDAIHERVKDINNKNEIAVFFIISYSSDSNLSFFIRNPLNISIPTSLKIEYFAGTDYLLLMKTVVAIHTAMPMVGPT